MARTNTKKARSPAKKTPRLIERGRYNDRLTGFERMFEVRPDGTRREVFSDELDREVLRGIIARHRGTKPSPLLSRAVSIVLARWMEETRRTTASARRRKAG